MRSQATGSSESRTYLLMNWVVPIVEGHRQMITCLSNSSKDGFAVFDFGRHWFLGDDSDTTLECGD